MTIGTIMHFAKEDNILEYNKIIKLYTEDLITDIQQFIGKKEIDLMLAEPDVHSKEVSINDLFEKWNGAFSYFQIKLLLTH